MFKLKHFLTFILILTLIEFCKSQADKDDDEIVKLVISDRCLDAIQLATKFIEINPNDARFYYRRGYCFLRFNVYKAKEDFANCIRIDPKYEYGYYGLAMAYEAEGQFELAEKYYKKAIEMTSLKERKATFINGLAFYYYISKKDYKKAIEIENSIFKLADDGVYYLNLGRFYSADGQKKLAESLWIKAIDEKKFREVQFKHITHFELADYYFQEKDYKKSKENIEKAIELAPNENIYVNFFNKVKPYVK